MQLSTFERRLWVQLARAETAYLEASVMTRHHDRQVRRHKLEGALSDAWQSYCDFVRTVCVNSAIGCTTTTGTITVPSITPTITVPSITPTITVPSITPTTWQRVSHIAIHAAKNKTPHPSNVNQTKRNEPTWGDSKKIIDIITALAPSNATTLINYFGGSLYGPPHCQLVRNACAHKNDQTLEAVRKLSVLYYARPITTPTDSLFWVDTVSGKPAFISWLEDMRAIAANAIK